MGKFLKRFQTTAQYDSYAASASFITPNVSACDDAPGVVYYNPNSPTPPVETRVVAKYNVTDTSNPTMVFSKWADNAFSAMEVDGVEETISTGYTFSTTGEHTVKFEPTYEGSIIASSFEGCKNLISIEMPNSITNMNGNVFDGCSGLTTCVLSDNIIEIWSNTFSRCSSLSSITIPNSVTSIGGSAFSGCTSLSSVTIPNNVTYVGDYAFRQCTSITSCTIGSSVTKLDNGCFLNCSNLSEITSLATTAPQFGTFSPAFSNVSATGTLYIPQGSDYSTWLSVLGSGWTTAPIQ